MGRNSLVGALLVFAPLSCSAQEQPQVADLIRRVGSADAITRVQALKEIRDLDAKASASAAPAVRQVLERGAWRDATTMNLSCEVLRASPATSPQTLALLVHFLVEAEADGSGEPVHYCVEAIAADIGPALVPAAVAATSREARAWWKTFNGDVPSMFDSMALARASFGRPFTALGSSALPGLTAGISDSDPFMRAEAAAFLAGLGPVARPVLPSLKRALARERSPWPRHELQQAVRAIEEAPSP